MSGRQSRHSSSSSSRDSERRKERSRERSRERDKDRKNDRTRDLGKERERSRERTRDRRTKKNESAKLSNETDSAEQEVTETIVLRGLKSITTEELLLDHIKAYGPVDRVRIVREKNGESRGFAFADFANLEDAKAFMNYTNGVIVVDGCNVNLDYTKGNSKPTVKESDWICSGCNASNFARRRQCYMCQAQKTSSTKPASEHDDLNPCPVIVIRGLDYSTTEQTLWNIFSNLAKVKEIRLIKDKISLASRGFAFVEFFQVEDAVQVMKESNSIKIDGRTVKLAYTNRTPKGPFSEAVEQAQWLAQQYYDRTYSWPNSGSSNNTKSVIPEIQIDTLALINSKDLSQFVYDKAYSHYYHAPSGIYYEPKGNYYWDSINSLYYNFDETTQQYVASSSIGNKTTEGGNQQEKTDSKKDQKKENKMKPIKPAVMVNKKMNQNILKWTQKTKELVEVPQAEIKVPKSETITSSETTIDESQVDQEKEIPQVEAINATQVESTVQNSEIDEVELDESQIVVGNLCLLCKRQFNSLETIKKHCNLSDLHKHNLIIAKQKQLQRIKEAARLAEQQDGEFYYVEHKKRNLYEPFKASQGANAKNPEPSKGDLNENNIGSKLLEKMGWKRGEGIGKQSVVTAPIEVEMRAHRAGLGLHSEHGSNHSVLPSDTYSDAVKKRYRERYENMVDSDPSKKGKVDSDN